MLERLEGTGINSKKEDLCNFTSDNSPAKRGAPQAGEKGFLR